MREQYTFSNEDKQYAHDRAGLGLKTGELKGGKCEFPGEECFNKPEPFVAHLSGCFEASLERMTPESISDVKQNGMLQCKKHNEFHDDQEREHVLFLYEKPRYTTVGRRRNRRTQQPSKRSHYGKRRG